VDTWTLALTWRGNNDLYLPYNVLVYRTSYNPQKGFTCSFQAS
jgi:hypothetical protein